MNSQHAKPSSSSVTLPTLSAGVLRRFRIMSPSFDFMLQRLYRDDPAAARWLYGAAEDISPGDVDDKERYATLALGLYYMLNEQAFVDRFNTLYNCPAIKKESSNKPLESSHHTTQS